MGDISNGPVSTLPGQIQSAPFNIKCDQHPEREAVKRVQGETDSFGCEYIDMCQECYQQHREDAEKADQSGKCDWCKKFSERLFSHRDIEEGSFGRVYSVCKTCIEEERERWREEDEYYD